MYWHTELLLLKSRFPSLKYILKTVNFSIVCNGNAYLVLRLSSHRNSELKSTITRKLLHGRQSLSGVWSLRSKFIKALRTVGGLQTNTFNLETVTLGNGTVVHNRLSPGRIRIESVSAPTQHFSESSLPDDPRRENPTWKAALGEGPFWDHWRGHSCLTPRNTCGRRIEPYDLG